MKLFTLAIAISLMAASASQATERTFGIFKGQQLSKGARGITVEEKVRNDHPAFVVRVDVDHPNRVYKSGDLMKVNVVSEKDGYLYLFYHQADDSLACLFPNKIQTYNKIQAHRKTIVPTENDNFNLRIRPPLGEETLIAIVSLNPLSPRHFGAKSFTDSNATLVAKQSLTKAVDVELKPHPEKWAEHHIMITTVAEISQRLTTKRVGLFVALAKYQDRRIHPLPACRKDVAAVAETMTTDGKLDGGILLADEDATLKHIEQALRELKDRTAPNDDVFIYWTGHGGRCADDNGDEQDGDKLDEFLVPYDANLSSLEALRTSVLLDDTFGRWVQEFDGRKVAVIIDACHAGGQANYTKGLTDNRPFDFFLNEAARTKDIGQHDAAMLLSSQASETSKVRRDGQMSVMTGFLIDKVTSSNRVTLTDAYLYLKPRVLDYVKSEYPGSEPQTPILLNDIGTIYLRP